MLYRSRRFTAASFSRFGALNAMAQSASDYKALVCVSCSEVTMLTIW